MQFAAIITLALATAVAAKGNAKADDANQTLSTDQTCREMTQLQKLVDVANNQTELTKVTKGNATKAADLQAKASTASTTLQNLQSNTTLMSACAIVDAQQATTEDCQKTFALQRFIAFAANDSAVATVTQNNATKAADIQLKASEASAALETLTSNSTLQSFCPAVQTADDCDFMSKLQKFVNLANNDTQLTKVTKGNATKASALKADASLASTQLDAMMSNTTLMDACAALKTSKDGTSTGSAAAATTSSSKKSAAAILKFSSEYVFGTTLVAVAFGMMML